MNKKPEQSVEPSGVPEITLEQRLKAVAHYQSSFDLYAQLWGYDLNDVSTFQYHTSWDWLIPVCKKAKEDKTMMGMDSFSSVYLIVFASLDIEKIFQFISYHCIEWCNQNNIVIK